MKRIILSLVLLVTFFTMAYSQYAESFFTSNPNYKQELERAGVTKISIPATVNYKPLGIINWSEGFEGTTFPPTGWNVHQLDGGTQTWIRYTTTPIFGVASAAVRWESTTLRNDDWLVTPQFIVNPGAFLNFYAKRQSTTYLDSVEIYYSTTGGVPPSGYTRITTIMPAGTTPELFQISLNAYAGQNIYIAFRYKELDQFRFYLDSVYVETPVAIDAGVSAINKPRVLETTLGTTPQFVVKNFGANPTGPFQATLTIQPGGYSQTVNVSSLNSGQSVTIDLPAWTPATAGIYQVVAYTSLPGDLNPQNDTLKRTVSVTQELPKDFVYNLTTLYPGGISLYGLEFDGNYFYVTKWNENKIFRINKTGTALDSFTISGLSATTGLRDLAWDGQYLYGSTATTSVFRVDISTFTATTAFTSPIVVRSIGYDKANDAFWVSNWNTDLRLVSRTGATLQTITAATHGLTGMSGLAYDTLSGGGRFLWVLNGGTAADEKFLYKINALNGQKVDSFLITHHLPTGAIGGGVFVSDKVVTGSVTLGVLNQATPHLITGYRIGGVVLQPKFTVIHPNGGEVFNTNSKEIIVWKTENYTGNVDILGSLDGGVNFQPIASNIPNTGFYPTMKPNITTNNGLILVKAAGQPNPFDISDGPFSIVSATNAQVNFPVVVADGIFAQSLKMGLDPTATDGIDPALGEYELPPVPPATVFDARLIGTDIGIPQLGNGTYKDFRQGSSTFNGQKIHEIKYQVSQAARLSGRPITLYWDLPTNVTGRLQDLVSGSIIDVPMSGSGSYTVENPALYDKLKVTYTYTYTPPITGQIKILYPNGGESLRRGSNLAVAWLSNVPGRLRLYGSTNAGTTWILLQDSLANTGVFGSTIGFDTPESNQWKIKLESISNPTIFDESDGTFTIQGTKLVYMDNPFVISDGNSSVGLFYGIDPNATDGIDLALGEAELPPPPPTGVFDGRFVGTNIGIPQLGQGTLKDYRQGGSTFAGNKIHEIQYQLGSGDSIRLFWYLPSNVTGLLQDFLGGSIVNVPMVGAGKFIVPNPGILNRLKITLTYTPIVGTITVVQPNGGENWVVGTTRQIIWNATNVQNVRLEYSTNNGSSWIFIAQVPAKANLSNDKNSETSELATEGTLGTYNWVIPNTPSNQCLVRVSDVANPAVFDVSDNVFTISSAPVGPQLYFNYNITTLAPGAISLYGSEFDGQYFYITRWNEAKIFRVNKAGTQIDSFTITGLPSGGIRDLAFDGQFLYGSNNTTTVYRIDRTTFAATTAFTSPIAVRGISYNAAQNAFWVANWNTNIVLVSRTGATLYTITAAQHGLTGMAGNAYDTLSSGGPYLWIFNGGTAADPKVLYKISPTNGQRLDSIDVTGILPTGAIGGGLWVTGQFDPGTIILGGSSQATPHRLFGYLIGTTGPITPTVTVVQPNGGENLFVGQTYQIIWNATGIANVRLEYSTNGGTSWIHIATVPAYTTNKAKLSDKHPKDPNSIIEGNLGTYNWVVPNTPSNQCLVRVSDNNNPSIFDVSDNFFTISTPMIEGWVVQSSGTTAALYSISAVNENVAWACGANGVVLRTTNGGQNWQIVTSPRAVDAYVIWALSATKAFVGTSGATDAKIHMTTNGGLTWADVSTITGGFLNVIRFVDENNGWAQSDPVGGNWVLLKTTNGGLNWTSMATVPQVGGEYGWNNSGWDKSGYMWFGTNNSRIYYSTNNGVNWSFAATTSANSYAVAFNPYLTGLSGFGAGVLNRSTNGGTSWSALTSPTSADVTGIATAYPNEFFVSAGGSVWKTTNAGDTWTLSYGSTGSIYHISLVPTVTENPAAGWAVGASGLVLKYRRQAPQPSVTVVQPNGGENWPVGSTQNIIWNAQLISNVRLEYTTNNGVSWIHIATVPASKVKKVKLDGYSPKDPNGVIEGELGVYAWTIPNTPSTQCKVRVSDAANPAIYDESDNVFTISTGVIGESWTVQSSGTTAALYSVSTVDENVAWATGVGGVVVRTTNGGTTWQTVTTPRAVDAHIICGISASKALVATNGATDAIIHLTTNGGQTWQNVFTQAGGFINVIIMFDDMNGFAQGDPVGGNWTLLRTTNGGLTWSSVATLPQVGGEYGWNNSGWNVGDNLWFGTNNSRVYKSTNRGSTWTFAPTTVVNGYSLAFGSALKGVLGSATGTANRSTDGGNTWVSITTPATGNILGMTTLSENEYWFTAGTSVFYTSNHGTNWSTSFTATQSLNHLHFKGLGGQNAVGYAVGANGYVAKYFRGPVTPQITVVSPNGGENWTVGSTRQIVWNAQAVQNVRLEYTTNNGASWIFIAQVPAKANLANNMNSETSELAIEGTLGTYNWVIPNTPSNQCRVRVSDVTNPAVFDVSDNVFTISTGVPGPQLQFNYDITALAPGAISLYGSEFDGQYFYITRWNEAKIFRVNKAGTQIDSFTITGLPSGGIRDLAFDGQFLYGSNNSTTVYRIDRTTFAATTAFTSPLAVRGISFNAAQNAFWVANWSTEIRLVSRTGATLFTIPAAQHGFTGMSGNAYDTLSAGGPYLWIFSGGTTTDPKILYKINPANGQRLDSIDVTGILPTGAIGGGLWVTQEFEPNTVTLGGSSQATPHRLFGYKIHEFGPIPGSVTVLSPNGGEKFYRGQWQLITWKSFEFDNRVKIKVSSNGGASYFDLVANILNNGIFATQIPNDAVIGNQYKIRIESQTDPTKFDESDGTFEIASAPYTLPVVDLPMIISDNDKSRLLRFGLDPLATDGIDTLFREEELPPSPPPGVLDGRFIGDDIGLQLGQGLAYDYRRGRANSPSIKIHELKFQKGAGDFVVINLYLPADVTARFQSFTGGFDTTVSGVARIVVRDTLLNKLKITINYFPSAVLGTFSLFGPFNNQLVAVRQNDTTFVTFRWYHARNAVAYRLRMGVPTVPPFMLDRPSNNNGTDSILTIRQHDLFSVFTQPGHPTDTTITGQWAVWAYDVNGDSLRSTNVFAIRLRLIRFVSVDEQFTGVPSRFVVYQNYPNPFNPSTKIKFGLPEDADVTIEVFNVVGEKVATLFNGNLKRGYHEVSFDAQGLQSGVYFYKIDAGKFSTVKKMLLIK